MLVSSLGLRTFFPTFTQSTPSHVRVRQIATDQLKSFVITTTVSESRLKFPFFGRSIEFKGNDLDSKRIELQKMIVFWGNLMKDPPFHRNDMHIFHAFLNLERYNLMEFTLQNFPNHTFKLMKSGDQNEIKRVWGVLPDFPQHCQKSIQISGDLSQMESLMDDLMFKGICLAENIDRVLLCSSRSGKKTCYEVRDFSSP